LKASSHKEDEVAAYVIAEIRIKDRDPYVKELVPIFDASHKEYGGRMLARADDPDTFAGMPPGGRIIVLEFPDLGVARRWWNSTEMREARERRDVYRINSMFTVEGIVT
jgi:uncharacterized protein (DUF1330 family)